MLRTLVLTLLLLIPRAGVAESLRFATYNVELTRRGPGLLLDDINKRDAQVMAVAQVIAEMRPDVLHLTSFDWDYDGRALAAFVALLGELGVTYPYRYAPQPNVGLESGADLDGNGRLGEARDSQGYGSFTGQGGMAVLSRFPWDEAQDFSALLWRDLPNNLAPNVNGVAFPSAEAAALQRLSSVGHWRLPLSIGLKRVDLMVWHGSTPVFDGPEDLNGRRGADEALFWLKLMNDALPFPPPNRPVVLMGDANIDPADGEGWHEAIAALLSDPRLQDTQPTSAGGTEAGNPEHIGNPGLDTADFDDPSPGNLRVDYVLPDAGMKVTGSGVYWPAATDPMAQTVAGASRHRLVWVDVLLP